MLTVVSSRVASALVFGSSAAVLVVELTALRLLAPYLGLTLETSTIVIGVALTAIAAGSAYGGRVADLVRPERMLAPIFVASGVAVALTTPVVRAAGEAGSGEGVLPAAMLAIFVPGALLSAVTPAITKLRLQTLDETGTVVGRLSGIGTGGAIFGTVLTGFVLVSRVPVSLILIGLGVLLVVVGVALAIHRRGKAAIATPAAAVVLGMLGLAGLATAVAPGGCDAETTYHCAQVRDDPDRPSGRLLVLDGLRHSYVDLDDPTFLEFEYVRAVASAADTQLGDPEAAVDAYHIGGGGLTVPRYLAAVRPGTTSLVSEIDGGVLALDRERLGLETGDDLEVRVEDGRLGLERLPDGERDLVVGDAFGGVSVPWHLTTREALQEVRRVLADDGVYVVNLIDHGPLDFARAELATLRAVFGEVALAAEPAVLAGDETGGNLVALASDAPLDPEAWKGRMDERDTGYDVATGAALDAWIGGADVLTDDHAPVDQLLTPYPTR